MSGVAGLGPVERRLFERSERGPLHFTLIDPERSDPVRSAEVAGAAADLGTDAIMIGGSTGISHERVGAVAASVKRASGLPTIIFPEGPGSLGAGADAIFFMSLLNSRRLDLVIRTQARAALGVKRLGLEPIPMGYLVVAPGMRVGEVGEADVIERTDLAGAQGYALAAEYLGMRWVYLEAGSGAPEPVPGEMVRAVRSVLSARLIVGGGIRRATEARALLAAGARGLVTGTITEGEGLSSEFRAIVAEVARLRER